MVRAALNLVIGACLLLVGSCASAGTHDDATGGLTMEMYITRPGNSFARYKLDRDGTLHFGGGFDAQARRYTWSGPMTDEEILRLLEMIETYRWFEAEPSSGVEEKGRTFEIDLEGADRHRKYTVTGDSPAVVAVYDLLRDAAMRRHEGILRSLPEADAPY